MQFEVNVTITVVDCGTVNSEVVAWYFGLELTCNLPLDSHRTSITRLYMCSPHYVDIRCVAVPSTHTVYLEPLTATAVCKSFLGDVNAVVSTFQTSNLVFQRPTRPY